ncbi:MAG: LemA family protein [Alloprevotella sp.]|nr:LemA family protein [Alloprevotella sp.]
MKKLASGTVVLLGILGVALILFFWGVSVRNNIVVQDEGVSTAWSNVQTQYQRRADLIPNLVNTVKGYAKHEQETFTQVVEARTKATQVTVDPENLTPEKLQEFNAAQGELSQALGRLIAIQESYPDLKANEQFMELQAQLEGTENRINESRTKFNEAVQTYNQYIRQFPQNIVASICSFAKKDKFEASAAAQDAPVVNFNE